MKKTDFKELFICQCGDPSHQFIISSDKEFDSIVVSVHLNRDHNIFKRMWNALRYVFGRRSIYGDFDEILINPEDAGRLQTVVDHLKTVSKKHD